MSESKTPKDIIKNYLDERAKSDELFAEKYANPKKSINECWDYIVGEASKRGNCVAMSDEEVFGLAVHYYDEENIKVEKIRSFRGSSVGKEQVELTEEEKEEARQIAKERTVRKLLEEQKNILHKPKAKKKDESHTMMGDLFG